MPFSLNVFLERYPFGIYLSKGTQAKVPLNKREAEEIKRYLEKEWYSGLNMPKSQIVYGNDGSTIILTIDEVSRKKIKNAINRFQPRKFRGWDLEESDGLVEAEVYLQESFDHFNPQRLFERFFNKDDEVFLESVKPRSAGGRTVKLRLTQEAAHYFRERDGMVTLGLTPVRVILKQPEGEDSIGKEDFDR